MQTSASAELLDQPPARWVNLALQRFVLPEVMFGRGIGLISYITSAEVRTRRALAELFADPKEGR